MVVGTTELYKGQARGSAARNLLLRIDCLLTGYST